MSLPLETTNCAVCGADDAEAVASGSDYVFHGSSDVLTAVGCRECGHIYLNPRPTPAAIGVMYPPSYPSFSGTFSSRRTLFARLKDRVMLSRLVDLLDKIPSGGVVLDLGCGDGALLLALRRRRPDLELAGLDWSFSAEQRQRLARADIRLWESRLEGADLPNDHFDLIVLNQLIEHLWEPREAMKAVWDALKPGGRVAIETPNIDGYDRRWFRAGTWGGYYFPRHLNLFSGSGLQRFLESVGYQIERRRNLPAPMIWAYSLQAEAQARVPRMRWTGLGHNPFTLAGFALIDVIAMAIGLTTSNQKVIAIRRESQLRHPL